MPAGNYVLTARAWDNTLATTTSSPVNITVTANGAPSASLTSPANGASFSAPATINLTASATDADGSIAQVEFFQGTSLLHTDTSAPYSFSWTSVAAGSYALSARATDNLGALSTSSTVNISVAAGHALYFIHPDHLNTPRVITNQNQQVVWRWDNDDPFGGNMAKNNLGGLGAFEFNLRFPGQYFDRETNNHYNYYRDYNPEIGRYVEADPLGKGLMPTTPTTHVAHTYVYVSSNPLARIDPLGRYDAPPDPPLLLCQSDPDYIPGNDDKRRSPSLHDNKGPGSHYSGVVNLGDTEGCDN